MDKRVTPAFALALIIAGCSVQSDNGEFFGTQDRFGKDPQTLFVNAGGEPEYIDPGKAHDSVSSKLVQHLFEGLAAYGPDAEPVPGVAESYERSKDNLYFRFHLRKDAAWSDGKPVTAQEFEYAWKRVLDPATASQASPNIYFLRNGELFNQGKLLRAQEAVPVFEAPDAQGQPSSTLEKGTIVLVLGRTPVKVESQIAPLTELPEGLESIGYDAANPKKKTPEKLVQIFANETRAVAPSAGALPVGDYNLVRVRAPVICNGDKDYFFELAGPDGKPVGVLPGCMLKPSAAKQSKALIAKWDSAPTYDPKARAQPAAVPIPLGFASEDNLISDTSMLGVRALDDHTLEVEAEYPVPYILDLLCAPTTYPVRKDLIEPFKARGEPDLWTRPETFIGNGPYMIDSWKFRYEIRMKRNPHHRYLNDLKIHNIVWMAVESYVSTMNLYKAGELDYIGDNSSLPPPYLPVLRKKKDFELTNYVGTYWYELNTKVPPLDKVEVRQALNLAIDKQQLADKVLRGSQAPATHFVPDFMGQGYADYVEELRANSKDPFDAPELKFNPELARSFLRKAGYNIVEKNGGFVAEGVPPIELLYNTSEGHRAVAVTIQDMWKKNLGIEVQLRNEEWGVMLKNVRDKNFQVVRFGWIADFDHPQTFLDTFMAKSPNNRTGWSNAKYDALVQSARSTADVKESMRLYREAEGILAKEVPKIPLYFYTKSTLVKPYVKGFHFNRRNEQLTQWMWLDPDWKNNPSDEPAFPVPAFAAPAAY